MLGSVREHRLFLMVEVSVGEMVVWDMCCSVPCGVARSFPESLCRCLKL